MNVLTRIFAWIGENEATLSGLAASIVIIGVLFTPLGRGLRALLGRRREAGDTSKLDAGDTSATGDANLRDGRPSVAVLPFTAASGEAAQTSLADTLTEDVINALSRVKHFDVLARGATFAYKDRQIDVREVGRELGARYVVEGSVRSLGDRVRVTVELVDAESRAPAWSDRHEFAWDRLHEAQDETTARIAAQLQPALRRAEAERVKRLPSDDLDSWSLVNRAWVSLQDDLGSPEVADAAVADCERAVAAEPDDALAHAVLAHAISLLITRPDNSGDVSTALDSARRAIALGGHDPAVQHCYAAVLANVGRAADAARAWERCLELDPNNAAARAGLGITQIYLKLTEESIENIDRALALSPRDPLVYHWLAHRAMACVVLNRTEEAALAARESVERTGTSVGWGVLTIAEAELGNTVAATEAWNQMKARTPGLTLESISTWIRSMTSDEETAERRIRAAEQYANADKDQEPTAD